MGLRKADDTRSTVLGPVVRFLKEETTGGYLLLGAVMVALAVANSPASSAYEGLWTTKLSIGPGPLAITEDLRHWINDGLMTLFFFVVGLEIKRELVRGELRDRRTAALPAIAAVGGVVLPALTFLVISGGGERGAGWGIPIATDIAFAVGVLAALGDRVPSGAKLLLLSIAIVDDILAIAVIAVFYSSHLAPGWLAAAGAGLVLVLALRAGGVRTIWPYVVTALGVWYATHESGVHATIAGVALALLTPARPFRGRDVLGELESRLHPVTAFVVVPAFALANAGVDLRGTALPEAAGSRIAWGVAAGLLLGKTLGIGIAASVAVRARVGSLPCGLSLGNVWGIAALAGIGFTVSLFIAGLAYHDPASVEQAKIGIFAGSLAGGVIGAALLTRSTSAETRERAASR
ncbi:Na+/H+ antiporter NhaA [Actinopolymorpha sp. B17G11]